MTNGTVTVEGDAIVYRQIVSGLEPALLRFAASGGTDPVEHVRWLHEEGLDDAVRSAEFIVDWGSNVWLLAWRRFDTEGLSDRADDEADWRRLTEEWLSEPEWADGQTDFALGDGGWDGLDNWVPAVEGRLAGSLFFARELLYDDGLWP